MQATGWWGMGGFDVPWNNPFMLPAFVIFLVATLAETKRAPFDLPEAESELVAGFMTEYSGIRWSFFFMEEYAAMFLMSGRCGLLPGRLRVARSRTSRSCLRSSHGSRRCSCALTLLLKGFFGIFMNRWTLPRVLIDQLTIGYKYLVPALAFVRGRRVPDDVAALDPAARAHRSGHDHGPDKYLTPLGSWRACSAGVWEAPRSTRLLEASVESMALPRRPGES